MGTGNKVEFLVAICALVASVMAVYIAWDQGRVMRAQQHAGVFPVLQVDGYVTNRAEHTAVGIEVRNSGVGPALIESVEFFIDGETSTSFGTELDSLPTNYELSWAAIVGRALAPGEGTTPIELTWPLGTLDTSDVREISSNARSWGMEICYCSVFERCWKTREIGRSRAVAVASCQSQEIDLFENVGLRSLAEKMNEPPTQEASE